MHLAVRQKHDGLVLEWSGLWIDLACLGFSGLMTEATEDCSGWLPCQAC